MKKNQFIVVSLLLFVVGCINSFEERSIEEFHIEKNLLKEGELVEIIYYPNTPDYNTNLDYYVKAIVVSKETNDTINVLTTSTDDLPSNGNLRNFISQESDANKIFENVLSAHINGETLDNINVEELKEKKIEKVILNKYYRNIEENTYPTTVGVLGHVTDIENGH